MKQKDTIYYNKSKVETEWNIMRDKDYLKIFNNVN